MLFAVILLQASSSTPPIDNLNQMMALRNDCVAVMSETYAELPDAADIIARAVNGACRPLDRDLKNAAEASLISQGVGAAMARDEAQKLLIGWRSDWEADALARIIKARHERQKAKR